MIGEAWTTARVFDSNITAGETVMGFDTEKNDSSDDEDGDTIRGAVATVKKAPGSTTARSGDAGRSYKFNKNIAPSPPL